MFIGHFTNLQLAIFVAFLIVPFTANTQNATIDEKSFIAINGTEQWVTIKGQSSKPVILFLHGGPGSPISPYADVLFKGWEKDFILVQWDQRGTGKTFGRTAPEELSPAFLKSNPLNLEEMVKDGIELTEYLLRHLGKQKIILFGTSWGSVLGIQMAEKRPDLFSAYVGHSQVVYPSERLKPAFQKVYQLAQKNNDQKSLATLNAIGMPPYDTARHTGQLMRIIKIYERLYSQPAPEEWFTVATGYDSEKDEQHRADGDDYSFVNFVGDKRLGVAPMSQPASVLVFQVPVYFIQGEEDILTPKEISTEYFIKVNAPAKEYFLLPQTAHGFNEAVVEAMLKIFHRIKP